MELITRLAPLGLSAEVSGRCNLNCRMCLRAASDNGRTGNGLMSDTTWRRVLKSADQGVERATLVGFGEPLTHPGFLDMADDCDRVGWHYGMSTNGLLLGKDLARGLSRLQGLIHVNFSLDSADPDIYHNLRGVELEQALAGVRNLVRGVRENRARLVPRLTHGLRRLIGRVDNRPWLTASALLAHRGLDGLKGLPGLMSKLGLQALLLQSLLDYNPAEAGQHITGLTEAVEVLEELEKTCLDLGIELTPSNPDRLSWERYHPDRARELYFAAWSGAGEMTRVCHQPWQTPHVDHTGAVYPCCYAAGLGLAKMGDLAEDDLVTIWHGESFTGFRRDIASGETLPRPCRTCLEAPWGKHPLTDYSARIVESESRLNGDGRFILTVVNTGRETWRPEAPVLLATSHPINRKSDLYHSDWPSNNRPAICQPPMVPPDGEARFEFPLGKTSGPVDEVFELVAEGRCQIGGTEFRLKRD